MTTNETMVAVTLLIGQKIYGYQERFATEDWQAMTPSEQAAYKLAFQLRVVREVDASELLRQTQVYVTDAPSATYVYNPEG